MEKNLLYYTLGFHSGIEEGKNPYILEMKWPKEKEFSFVSNVNDAKLSIGGKRAAATQIDRFAHGKDMYYNDKKWTDRNKQLVEKMRSLTEKEQFIIGTNTGILFKITRKY